MPDAGDGMPADWAGAVFANQNRTSRKATALDQLLAALRAVSVLSGMPRHVADVDVVQSLGIGNGLGALQRGHRCNGQILEQVIGMELSKVQWNIRAKVGFDPFRHIEQVSLVVVERWDYQIDDLEPLAHLAQRHQRVEHGL